MLNLAPLFVEKDEILGVFFEKVISFSYKMKLYFLQRSGSKRKGGARAQEKV